MVDVKTPDDVYPAIDELVSALNLIGKTDFAAKLQHQEKESPTESTG
jgi:hypothetical protein